MDNETILALLTAPELRFAKDPAAAGLFLLAVSNTLLESGPIPKRLRITLGQILREAALTSLDYNTSPDDNKCEINRKVKAAKDNAGITAGVSFCATRFAISES